ncbi:MAG: hypothetical protein K2M11_08160 [Paramuribaculum sp.]|nr:hypothetical protein [Paramuribaculum sp.]
MKKLVLLFACLIPLLAFTACEEKDSPLRFSQEEISNPKDVKLEYYSPDPSCVAKMYWITANSCASKISLRCTNANSIAIENHEGKILEEYTSAQGQWKAELVSSNTITFTFNEIDGNSIDESYSTSEGFNVISQTKKGVVRANIGVTRLTKSTDPI